MTANAEALATGPLGMRLLAFERLPERTPPTGHELTYVLLAVRSGGLLLLVRERVRDCWELPGGGIDPGESTRQAAVRELAEETGLHLPPEALRFAGYARTALPQRSIRYGALFTAEVAEADRGVFAPTEEIAATCWWNGSDPLPGGQLQTVDTYLAELATEHLP